MEISTKRAQVTHKVGAQIITFPLDFMLASRLPQLEHWNLVEAVLFTLSHAVRKSKVFPLLWLLLLMVRNCRLKSFSKECERRETWLFPVYEGFVQEERIDGRGRCLRVDLPMFAVSVVLPMKSCSWYGIPSEAISPNKWRVSFVVDHWCYSNTRWADSSSSTTQSLPEQAIQRECQIKVLTHQRPTWIHAWRKEETFNPRHAS